MIKGNLIKDLIDRKNQGKCKHYSTVRNKKGQTVCKKCNKVIFENN